MNTINEAAERERPAFEAAFSDKLDFLRLSPDAEYFYSETGHAWDGWQARATLLQASGDAVAWMVQDAADVEIRGTGTCILFSENPGDYGKNKVTPLYATQRAEPAPDMTLAELANKWDASLSFVISMDVRDKLREYIASEIAKATPASADSAADARDAARWRYFRDSEVLDGDFWEEIIDPDERGIKFHAQELDYWADAAITRIQSRET
jgi:hypothetical protein